MIFYLDTEFNGFHGELLTLALVSEDQSVPPLYLARNDISVLKIDPWVKDNVLPIIEVLGAKPTYTHISYFGRYICKYLTTYDDDELTIVADWPDDIRYLMAALITGPGTMVDLDKINICMRRCDPYKNNPDEPTRHNALCDARALRNLFT